MFFCFTTRKNSVRCAALGAILVSISSWSYANTLLEVHTFESGKLELGCQGDCPKVSKDVARSGKYSMKSSTASGSSKKRAEARPIKTAKYMQFDRDYWIGFSVFLPKNWSVPGKMEAVAQIFRVRDDNEPSNYATQPNIALYTGSGEWKIKAEHLGNNGAGMKEWYFNSVYEDVGRWTDFVIHFRPSYKGNGVIKVWKNGSLVASYGGKTSIRSKQGLSFKMGLYKGPYQDKAKFVYHDDLRIASGPNARYSDVAPKGSPQSGRTSGNSASSSNAGSNEPKPPASTNQAASAVHTFETGKLTLNCNGNCPSVTSQRARRGKYSMVSRVRASAKEARRTEAAVPGELNSLNMDQAYWIGFSVYLPYGWQADGRRQVVAQLQRTPDNGEKSSTALSLNIGSGDWAIESTRNGAQRVWELNSAYEDVGRWTDFVILVKPSPSKNGVIAVWKNGDPVVFNIGPNIERDKQGPKFRMGLDTPIPQGKDLVVYHDELRIFKAALGVNYKTVAPR